MRFRSRQEGLNRVPQKLPRFPQTTKLTPAREMGNVSRFPSVQSYQLLRASE
jgi:hypothetical protein